MKKLLAVLALALMASPAFAGITNTAHDLVNGSNAEAGANAEICVYCHTPHGANVSVTTAPLWNRTTGAVVGLYSGLAINGDATAATVAQTDAPLCISCHDGNLSEVLANEPNGGATNTAAYAFTSAAANLGTNMNNDHPIGFNYSVADAGDPELVAKATVQAAAGMSGALNYGGGDQMWCSSCHDVHNNTAAPFLRMSNAGSNLCLTCHQK